MTRVSSQVPVVVLAGGRGVRLRPLTLALPKPLLPVHGEPILGHLLRQLRAQGFQRIFLTVGHLHDLVIAYARSRFTGLTIEVVIEPRPLGTAGSLRLIANRYRLSGPILVVNGDIVSRIRFDHVVGYHRRTRSDLTLTSRFHHYQLPFGEIALRGANVVAIVEKPVVPFRISAGVYVVNRTLVNQIPPRRHYGMSRLIDAAVRAEARVRCYHFSGPWRSVDELNDLIAANQRADPREGRSRPRRLLQPTNPGP
jgi:NDP-sugar pyrophosphorylase family protein